MKLISTFEEIPTNDTKYDTVAIPEWGAEVGMRVRSLTAFEREKCEQASTRAVRRPDGSWTREQNVVNMRARMIAKAAVDEQGKQLFSDEEKGTALLATKNSAVIDRVWTRILKLSSDTAEAKQELGEASGSDQNDASN